MQHLEISGAVRPIYRPLGIKWLMYIPTIKLFVCIMVKPVVSLQHLTQIYKDMSFTQ